MPPASRNPYPRRPPRRYPGRRADAARWVRDALRSQIMEGAFGGLAATSPALPQEPELCAEFGVSRNVVREALDLLRAEGLVTRIPGAGTFVTGAKLRQRLDRLEGLAESLAGHELQVDNRVLSVREGTANPFVADKLAVAEGSPILFVERLRSAGGTPLSLDTSFLRPEAIGSLKSADFARADIFSLIEKMFGVPLGWAEVTIESVAADAPTGALLQIRQGSPLLLLHRLTYLADRTPFDLEAIRFRGDRSRLITTVPRTSHRGPGTNPDSEVHP